MPWNITASLHGGSRAGSRQASSAHARPFLGSGIGGLSSAGGPSSLAGGELGPPATLPRRPSRITSASPLIGRGPQIERLSSLESIEHGGDDDDFLLGGQEVLVGEEEEFQLYGPAAGVDTQTAAQSQWMKATLDQESSNFLDFLRAEVATKVRPEEEEAAEGEGVRSVTFEELLPPTSHSKIVAAQALHHVLALASKGLVGVRQDEGYADIHIRVAAEV